MTAEKCCHRVAVKTKQQKKQNKSHPFLFALHPVPATSHPFPSEKKKKRKCVSVHFFLITESDSVHSIFTCSIHLACADACRYKFRKTARPDSSKTLQTQINRILLFHVVAKDHSNAILEFFFCFVVVLF